MTVEQNVLFFGEQDADRDLHNTADLRFVDKHHTMLNDYYELSRTTLTNYIAVATKSM